MAEIGQYERQAMELAAKHLKPRAKAFTTGPLRMGKGITKSSPRAANELVDVNDVDIFITSAQSLTVQPITTSRPLWHSVWFGDCGRHHQVLLFYQESRGQVNPPERCREFPRDARSVCTCDVCEIWTTAVEHIYKLFR